MLVLNLTSKIDDAEKIKRGWRFVKESKTFEYKEEWFTDDEDENLSDTKRIVKICLPAMNSINPDLRFTVETQDDFEKQRLPTLDFELWKEGNLIRHSYFQKAMKTPLIPSFRTNSIETCL